MDHKDNYKIRIDKEMLLSSSAKITGREVLALVDKTTQRYRLHQKLKNGRVEIIAPDQVVDLSLPGLERFMTLPLDQTEGDASPRGEVRLPVQDEEFLVAQGYDWQAVAENGKQWLLISDFPLPSGYTTDRATVAVAIPPGYPDTQLDMAWFNPPVLRRDGRRIGQTQLTKTIASRAFQGWSRHRTRQNPWRPSVDCLSSHLGLVSYWLEREHS